MKNKVKARTRKNPAGGDFLRLREITSFLQEKQIKTWKGALIIALFTGSAVALIVTSAAKIYGNSGQAVTRADVSETADEQNVFPE